MLISFAAAMLALSAATGWYYQHGRRMIEARAADHLTAIGRLKTGQIAAWRRERLADAAVLAQGVAFSAKAARFLAGQDREDTQELRAWLRRYQEHYHYADILLIDRQGSCRLNLSGKQMAAEKFQPALAPAFEMRRPYLTDLHSDQDIPAAHVGAIAPIFAGNDPATEPLGAIILITYADQYLFPLLQTWPAPS